MEADGRMGEKLALGRFKQRKAVASESLRFVLPAKRFCAFIRPARSMLLRGTRRQRDVQGAEIHVILLQWERPAAAGTGSSDVCN